MTTTSNSTSIILYKYKEDKYSWKLIFHSQVTDKLGSLIQTTQSKTEGKTEQVILVKSTILIFII